jgi:hypothetical protein
MLVVYNLISFWPAVMMSSQCFNKLLHNVVTSVEMLVVNALELRTVAPKIPTAASLEVVPQINAMWEAF